MSAGKSTLINALLGQELLPAANQATTARIFRIENHDNHDFEMRYVSDNDKTDWVTATKENLKSFNDSSEPGQIELRGCIAVARTLQASLVLYDTPGPNNSQDINHAKTTLKLLKDSEHGLILYVLNATQVGVNDDAVLLRELKKMLDRPENSHKQVFFILNKADKLNKSRDGSLHEIVGNSAAYLKSFGFVNPVIIPICAAAALLAREAIAKGGITDHQLDELDYFERRFKKVIPSIKTGHLKTG